MLEHVWPSEQCSTPDHQSTSSIPLLPTCFYLWARYLVSIGLLIRAILESSRNIVHWGLSLDIVRQLIYSGDTGIKCSRCFHQYCNGKVLYKIKLLFCIFFLNSKGYLAQNQFCIHFSVCVLNIVKFSFITANYHMLQPQKTLDFTFHRIISLAYLLHQVSFITF